MASSSPVAQTRSGKVRGASRLGILSFKGIPYGASTAGANRFRAPQPVTPWAGLRDALEFGPTCPQLTIRDSEYFAWYHPVLNSGEDCLRLNVYTPGLTGKRPVMVWVHGGGFISGAGSAEVFEGTNLARYGEVVVVTVTHRLGVLGFLNLGAWDRSVPEAGNVGMLDLVAALEWVRDNIAAFGGDPGNITAFGQSGGTGKISTLLAMPSARGLVHKVIMQSGCALILRTPEQSERHTHSVLSQLPSAMWDGKSADSLRKVPFEQLVTATKAGGARFGAYVDGSIVATHPCEPDAPEVSREVGIIIGSTAQEASYMYRKDMAVLSLTDMAEVRARLQHKLGCDQAMAEHLIEVHRSGRPPNAKPATPAQLLLAIESDYLYRLRCIQYAERKAAQAAQGGAPVWMYYFSWQTPALGGLFGAPHCVCVPLVFRNQHLAANLLGEGPDTQAISDRLCKAWMTFAHNGSPSTGAGMSGWKPYQVPERATMIFDRECGVVGDPLSGERQAMARHGAHANYISSTREKFVRQPA
jgi:para-nitrobenzyl esterase